MTQIESLKLALRFALREIRGGLTGFYVFLACIALGTAAIGGVNAVSQAITQGIETEGATILGGDVRFELNQRDATAEERAYLDSIGTVAVSSDSRSMARLTDQSDQTLVELKSVDELYPLYGTFETEPAYEFDAMAKQDGAYGIYAQPILLDRLDIGVGERILIGNETYQILGVIELEPDALSEGVAFAPRVIMSVEGMQESGIIQP